MTANEVGFPYEFSVAGYSCVWMAGGRDANGETMGGCVAVRVAKTGDDTLDWYESDDAVALLSDARDAASSLIDEYEDSIKP